MNFLRDNSLSINGNLDHLPPFSTIPERPCIAVTAIPHLPHGTAEIAGKWFIPASSCGTPPQAQPTLNGAPRHSAPRTSMPTTDRNHSPHHGSTLTKRQVAFAKIACHPG
jgi:hypothetical protein